MVGLKGGGVDTLNSQPFGHCRHLVFFVNLVLVERYGFYSKHVSSSLVLGVFRLFVSVCSGIFRDLSRECGHISFRDILSLVFITYNGGKRAE